MVVGVVVAEDVADDVSVVVTDDVRVVVVVGEVVCVDVAVVVCDVVGVVVGVVVVVGEEVCVDVAVEVAVVVCVLVWDVVAVVVVVVGDVVGVVTLHLLNPPSRNAVVIAASVPATALQPDIAYSLPPKAQPTRAWCSPGVVSGPRNSRRATLIAAAVSVHVRPLSESTLA